MLTKNQIDAIRQNQGVPCAHVKHKMWEMIIRRPTADEWIALCDAVSGDNRKIATEMRRLIRTIAVYPHGNALGAMLEEYPGACSSAVVTDAVMMLVGADGGEKRLVTA